MSASYLTVLQQSTSIEVGDSSVLKFSKLTGTELQEIPPIYPLSM
jgi:hypothetical protein